VQERLPLNPSGAQQDGLMIKMQLLGQLAVALSAP
jgi:hypothetical protein